MFVLQSGYPPLFQPSQVIHCSASFVLRVLCQKLLNVVNSLPPIQHGLPFSLAEMSAPSLLNNRVRHSLPSTQQQSSRQGMTWHSRSAYSYVHASIPQHTKATVTLRQVVDRKWKKAVCNAKSTLSSSWSGNCVSYEAAGCALSLQPRHESYTCLGRISVTTAALPHLEVAHPNTYIRTCLVLSFHEREVLQPGLLFLLLPLPVNTMSSFVSLQVVLVFLLSIASLIIYFIDASTWVSFLLL